MSRDGQALGDGLPAGTLLGEYVIESTIGQGGYGVVYRARHRYLDTLIALKEYLPTTVAVRTQGAVRARNQAASADYEDGLRRFVEEARRLAQFRSNPGVVTCLGFFKERGTAYLAMEYEEGLPLSELLVKREAAGSPLSEGELLRLAEQLLESLAAVHEAGVLHRDIKPSNILIRRSDNRPVLIDFGAAKEDFVRHTKSWAPHTQGYAAIEQVEADGELGPWTDLYGLGAVLWRIVAGAHQRHKSLVPVDALSRMTARFRGQQDPQPSARELGAGHFSDAVLEVIDKCLELESTDRPAHCGELRGLLSVLVEEEPIQIVPSSTTGDGNAGSRREAKGSVSGAKPITESGANRGRVARASRTTLVAVATSLLVVVALGLIWHYGTGISVSELRPLLESARSGSADVGGLGYGDRLSRIARTLDQVYRPYTRYEYGMYRPYEPHNEYRNHYYEAGEMRHYFLPYDEGLPSEQDIEEAVAWLRKVAALGEVQAQLWLGWMHQFGRGLRKDHTKAVEWYLKAAALGSSEAQRHLGHAYYYGLGVPKDHTKAMELYRKAAGQGDVESQLTLGWRYSRYSDGMGLPKEYAEAAISYYRKAAEQGSSRAQYLLGQMYQKGQGVPADYLSAYAWTTLAAAQSLSDAEKARDRLESEMTTTQIAEGQSLSRKIAEAIADRDK